MAQGFASDIPPALNGTAKKYIRGMMKGKNRWNKLYGNRSKEVMHKTANKMAMGEMSKMPPTYKDVFGEANKSGDNSLRDWFGKSKSSDGTPGWVQLGGKFAGKPCAKQPGQTTKPKCGSSKMKRNLNKGEEEAAFRRKNAEDPNPDRKGKAKNVKTEDLDLKKMSKELDGASKMHKGQSERIKKHLKKMNVAERADMWHPDPKKDKKLGGPGANARAREDGAAASKPKADPKKLKPGESYMDYSKRQKASRPKSGTAVSRLNAMGANIKPKKKSLLGRLGLKKEDVVNEKAGEKDACYKKVKASAKVWPSAYASGRLVQCRKKGAANYGNKSEGMTFQQVQEKCWQGYKRVGMKKKGNKMVPNCVPEEVQTEGAAWTKKSGKNSEGGLNEKGRKSYEKENPGSDLKAPSTKVGNPRRASFCARMKGMRKRQKASNNTGDDRLSKSLRKWNC
ncbi:hypothetical protein Syn7803C76_101 [Synechococcus phage ACG-2014b]|uniref:DUF6321 domain-containing protein n=2 Tax=Synechococcus phage ACG-2014b TaxID=1493508 RepID=A0A0E3F5Q3_9CAUD|nr:hypothetical protein ABF04_gp101 [Synechococcus phage ACG-2014b]YP_009779726.1 hypothetical protein HOQ67_gp098 [Synechococcus phage ACG-2014b]AIX17320.1 hypothetical protein Syn7803C61_98 [Synechococcus phage ACG-2014b]AIX17968.1 hypothetical protein Syn7803C68_100 [Synechococcus phage ACG-2014b]AIX18183.1 hypothetical protein Syn7803C69_99 [Synechococcus phage ACG-2014b]AIX19341.1 hypothetical protein Syn7803C76_101 [Synechococcus phage ACG-2014b]AIX19775.1 hypothetical protein Syn7803C7